MVITALLEGKTAVYIGLRYYNGKRIKMLLPLRAKLGKFSQIIYID
jgi:hypothetical protein